MKYVIVSEADCYQAVKDEFGVEHLISDNFAICVNMMIDAGWEPIGGVSSIGVSSKAWLIQAMIKKD